MSVQVRDTGNPFRSSVTTLIIAVTDEDDSDPVFQHDIYEITVMENATGSLNTSPAAILAYDQDFGINQTLAYSLQEASAIPTDLSDLLVYFSIDGQTGELSVVRGLDREVVHDVTLIIKAEQANNNVRSAEARVYIVVQDANDNRPEMSASQYQATVVENTPSGFPVLTVTASDKDEVGNAEDFSQAFHLEGFYAALCFCRGGPGFAAIEEDGDYKCSVQFDLDWQTDVLVLEDGAEFSECC
ncbi:protocadherin gamma-B5-like [Branchiostoma floridae]|uniref:Protocadherin gamma-B5-like n=1 Tax=Branchiostoma floridae TaxID=7739 RepID=A0A9J7NDM6_BRAFL|nr:protocadherin gamma-B5-like [Branchiostoma floridae]